MQSRRRMLALAAASGVRAALGQVIEFEAGGLKFLTQTKNDVTVMFAPLPGLIRDYAIIQVAIANGSSTTWAVKPEDFRFQRPDGSVIAGTPARTVVNEFVQRGGRDDVVKLVTTYEMGLYGMNRVRSTNGYESRRQAAIGETSNPRLKAAAAASAIVLVQVKLKPGASTDGAVFYLSGGKPLGAGKLQVEVADSLFEFEAPAVGP